MPDADGPIVWIFPYPPQGAAWIIEKGPKWHHRVIETKKFDGGSIRNNMSNATLNHSSPFARRRARSISKKDGLFTTKEAWGHFHWLRNLTLGHCFSALDGFEKEHLAVCRTQKLPFAMWWNQSLELDCDRYWKENNFKVWHYINSYDYNSYVVFPCWNRLISSTRLCLKLEKDGSEKNSSDISQEM